MRKILVVDDEPEIAEFEKFILTSENEFEVVTAYNGAVALSFLQQHVFSLVIADIRMPVMTGLQLLQKMNELKIRVPLVFLTGYGDETTREAALTLGAIHLLEKPVDGEFLLRVAKATALK